MHLLIFFCRTVHQLAKPSKPQLDFAFIWRCQIFLQFSTILCEIPPERMHYFDKKCPMMAKMMIGSIQLMRWKNRFPCHSLIEMGDESCSPIRQDGFSLGSSFQIYLFKMVTGTKVYISLQLLHCIYFFLNLRSFHFKTLYTISCIHLTSTGTYNHLPLRLVNDQAGVSGNSRFPGFPGI